MTTLFAYTDTGWRTVLMANGTRVVRPFRLTEDPSLAHRAKAT
jgi:hypothetical protein